MLIPADKISGFFLFQAFALFFPPDFGYTAPNEIRNMGPSIRLFLFIGVCVFVRFLRAAGLGGAALVN
jgi:hypothetical protein